MTTDVAALPDSAAATEAKAQRIVAAALRKGDRLERENEMYFAVEALTAQDFRQLAADGSLLKMMAEKLNGNHWRTNRDLLSGLFIRWVKVDPGSMMALAPQALESIPKNQILRAWILDELGAKQSAEMLAFARTRKDASEREEIISRAMRELTLRDPAKARAWLAECTDPADRQVAEKTFRMGIVQTDPLRAIELAQAIGDGQEGWQLLRFAAENAARMGTGVLRQLATMPMKPWMLQEIAYELAESDPELAVDLALKYSPDGNNRGSTLQTAFTALAQRDPAQSIAKLEGLEGLDLASAVSAIGFAWAGHEPEAALNWLAERPSAERKYPHNLYNYGGNDTLLGVFWEWKASAESDARAWADALPPGKIRDAVQAQLARSLASEHGREAMQILAQLGKRANAVLGDTVSWWAESDPQAAADWAIAQEPGSEQIHAVGGIVGTWAIDDEQAAENWLTQLPPGEVRDRSIVSFLYRKPEWTVGRRERIAEFDACFDLIDDPWQRALAACWSFSQRKKYDPDAARAWLASLSNVDAELIRQTLRDSSD